METADEGYRRQTFQWFPEGPRAWRRGCICHAQDRSQGAGLGVPEWGCSGSFWKVSQSPWPCYRVASTLEAVESL